MNHPKFMLRLCGVVVTVACFASLGVGQNRERFGISAKAGIRLPPPSQDFSAFARRRGSPPAFVDFRDLPEGAKAGIVLGRASPSVQGRPFQ